MQIAFFTESTHSGRIARNFHNSRTDVAWQIALNSYHYPYQSKIDSNQIYDVGIIILPKKNPKFDILHIRAMCNVLYIMQEGPHWYYQDWSVKDQFDYLNTLELVDGILVHNAIDRLYFSGIGFENVHILPTLIIEDGLSSNTILNPDKRHGIMIGGNFTSWYSGIDSYLVSQVIDQDRYIVSMGRMQSEEKSIPDLIHIPYVHWRQWMDELSKRRYAIHLMRTFAAGTFALNCALLGIPCIGYNGLDTQMHCHPDTTVDIGDMAHAREILKQLQVDSEFYNHCANTSQSKYNSLYSEQKFLQAFDNILKQTQK